MLLLLVDYNTFTINVDPHCTIRVQQMHGVGVTTGEPFVTVNHRKFERLLPFVSQPPPPTSPRAPAYM